MSKFRDCYLLSGPGQHYSCTLYGNSYICVLVCLATSSMRFEWMMLCFKLHACIGLHSMGQCAGLLFSSSFFAIRADCKV